MNSFPKCRWRRKLFQTAFLILLFLPVWSGSTFWYGTYISSDLMGFSLTDPLTTLEITLARKSLWMPLLVSAIPLTIVALLFGRLFCSYICPLNFLLEFLPVKRKRELREKNLPMFVLFLTLLLSALFSVPAFNIVSPVFLFMRNLLFGAGIELILLGIVLIVSLFRGQKIWCRTLCPLGALYGLLGEKRRLFLHVDTEKCIRCGACTQACTMGTAPGRGNFSDAVLCTNCGDCMDACEKGAIRFTMKGKQKP